MEKKIEPYRWHDKKQVTEVIFNHCMTLAGEELCERRVIGSNGIIDIIEKPATGEGDKWFFDIVYENYRVERIFNPHQVFYDILKND